ncbi:MAG: type I glutamate--ammonia ligase [Patescibacteria group bacterium]|jgi:glutamine synthetase
MPLTTPEEVLKTAEKEQVKFIELEFCDLLGQMKTVTIPVGQLAAALHHNVWFDGSSIEGFARIFESDMYLKLDLGSFALLPWTVGTGLETARLICDVYLPDGQPYESDPRQILKRQLALAKAQGLTFNVGPELEFFLLKRENGSILPLPHDQAGYFDQSLDQGTAVRKEMAAALEKLGIKVEALHHEVASGQHEIDFEYGDALATADNALSFKMALRQIAKQNGLHASFMPKPFFGINGSGMHVHQSLARDGQNLFYAAEDKYGLSELAKKFMAGQLHHIAAMNAVLNPLVNSYKRLVVGYEAPVYITWGQTNRSCLIRVPRINHDRPQATRCELRCPDPAANPYLAFAVMLAAGLDGLTNDYPLPEPTEESVYELNGEAKKKYATLPGDLKSALTALQADPLISAVLGEATLNKYLAIKNQEWDSWRTAVTDWERENYLAVY